MTWINASYTVQPDMTIYNSGAMSLEWGVFHCISSKHKLNTEISTEDGVVGLSDYAPFNFSCAYSWKHMGNHSNKIWYIKITKVKFSWKVMNGLHLPEIVVTFISGISL